MVQFKPQKIQKTSFKIYSIFDYVTKNELKFYIKMEIFCTWIEEILLVIN